MKGLNLSAAFRELGNGIRRARVALSEPRSLKPVTGRMCPECARFAPLLAGVEDDSDSACRLWECETHGCFTPKDEMVGKRRKCAVCGHRESPVGDASCHAVAHLPIPCCFDPSLSETNERGVREHHGRCVYTEPPTLTWNPRD